MQHFDCSFIVLCLSPRLEGDALTIQELFEFRGLSVGEMGGKKSLCGGEKKSENKNIEKKVLMSLYLIPMQLELEGWTKMTAKYHFHPMMKLLPGGSNDFQGY